MQWRDVVGFEGYEVSSTGEVRRSLTGRGAALGRLLKASVDERGRCRYFLRRNGKTYPKYASVLVAEAWWGPAPFEGAVVCHNDSDPTNNDYKNLRWDTQKGNMADRSARGTQYVVRGEKHHNARLTQADVAEIRRLAELGHKQREIGEKFGIKQAQVSRIVNGVRWLQP